MTDLRAIIIDDDRSRREKIREILPDYIEGIALGTGEGAINLIKPDADGRVPDIVILDGDDKRSFGLYVFDWMLNKSDDPRTGLIPVIVLTADRFSERSLEFLELGDVEFYEGRIDENELFSMINDRLEEAEFMSEPVEPVYEEIRNIDRLMGQSVKAPGSIGEQRALVLDMDDRLSNLEAALERGKKRVSEIRALIDAAQSAKEDDFGFDVKAKKQGAGRSNPASAKPATSFLDKARKKVEEAAVKSVKSEADHINALKQKAMSNPYGAFNAQGTIRVEDRPKRPESFETYGKRTVVIADDDIKSRKLCSLFLTQNYSVITFDSGMKTIDYFVKNGADLLIINPVMKGVSGLSTVSSIHMQPGCAKIPVMYLVGDDFEGDRTTLLGNSVVGILNKPVKREVLAQAVEGYFAGRK